MLDRQLVNLQRRVGTVTSEAYDVIESIADSTLLDSDGVVHHTDVVDREHAPVDLPTRPKHNQNCTEYVQAQTRRFIPIAISVSFILSSFFLYLLTKRCIQMYCHVQRQQDNKAQITGSNSCPFSLNHKYRYKYNAVHYSAFSISKTLQNLRFYGSFKTC